MITMTTVVTIQTKKLVVLTQHGATSVRDLATGPKVLRTTLIGYEDEVPQLLGILAHLQITPHRLAITCTSKLLGLESMATRPGW